MAPFLLVTKSSPSSGGAQKSVTYRISLIGLSARLRKAIAIVYSRCALQSAPGLATLLLDRARDFVVAPSSVGGKSPSRQDSQGVDERATMDRYHHFHGHAGLSAWGDS